MKGLLTYSADSQDGYLYDNEEVLCVCVPNKFLRKRLFSGTLPANKNLFAGTLEVGSIIIFSQEMNYLAKKIPVSKVF